MSCSSESGGDILNIGLDRRTTMNDLPRSTWEINKSAFSLNSFRPIIEFSICIKFILSLTYCQARVLTLSVRIGFPHYQFQQVLPFGYNSAKHEDGRQEYYYVVYAVLI